MSIDDSNSKAKIDHRNVRLVDGHHNVNLSNLKSLFDSSLEGYICVFSNRIKFRSFGGILIAKHLKNTVLNKSKQFRLKSDPITILISVLQKNPQTDEAD